MSALSIISLETLDPLYLTHLMMYLLKSDFFCGLFFAKIKKPANVGIFFPLNSSAMLRFFNNSKLISFKDEFLLVLFPLLISNFKIFPLDNSSSLTSWA